jgi:hypothetical protein
MVLVLVLSPYNPPKDMGHGQGQKIKIFYRHGQRHFEKFNESGQ